VEFFVVNNDLASGRGNQFQATGTMTRRPPTRGAAVPAHPAQRDRTRPPSARNNDLKEVVTWGVRAILLSVAVVLVGLWLEGGGVSSVHSAGTFLTSLGRITGLFGAYLLLIQVLLMARLPFMEWVAGFGRLVKWHRLNGKLSLLLILAHVGCITLGYALADRVTIQTEAVTLLTQYPGMQAALVGTLMLILVVITSLVIVHRRLRYESWFLVHLMSYLGIFLAWFHQIPTGTMFMANPLAVAFWTALYVATLQFVLLFRVGQPIVSSLWHRLRVAEVIQEGPGVVSLRITGRHLDWLNAQAGQFFQWRFLDRERWRESHPFSLSAAPDGRSFRITVKELGDFSSRIGHIRPGTRVVAEGPFGAFTNVVRTRQATALIAGGIGITPIRALLEEMHGDIVLVYRAGTPTDLIFRDELERLTRLRGATLRYVIGSRKLLSNVQVFSREHLRHLVPDIADRELYICGPRSMMRSVKSSAQRLGVPPECIHIDDFTF
jgi:predicted ferric reductase